MTETSCLQKTELLGHQSGNGASTKQILSGHKCTDPWLCFPSLFCSHLHHCSVAKIYYKTEQSTSNNVRMELNMFLFESEVWFYVAVCAFKKVFLFFTRYFFKLLKNIYLFSQYKPNFVFSCV